MQVKDRYNWEIELDSGEILTNGNDFDFDKVVRVSFVPTIPIIPRHDVITTDCKFLKRFGRAFMSMERGVKEYLHCAVTDKYRVYVKSSDGSCLITQCDYELYV